MTQIDKLFTHRTLLWTWLLISVVVITGCATGKSVRSADDMVDDGKRNTMVVSYDITLNVTDKHPSETGTKLIIRCGTPNSLGAVPECFRVSVPLKGRTTADEFVYYSFSTTGTSVLQMPYGTYPIDSVGHNVVVDVYRTVKCRTAKDGRTTCRPVQEEVMARHRAKTLPVAAFDVEPGPGCYAGHLTIVMKDGELSTYSLDQSAAQPSADAIALLPTNIQDTVRGRVTQPCLPG